MFRNFLVSAFRNLRKDALVSGISILGLSTGMAVALLIIVYVIKELSYDRFEQSDRIYRVELMQSSDQSPKWAISHYQSVKHIAERSAGIEEVMFYKKRFQKAWVESGGDKFFEADMVVSNAPIVSFTDLRLLRGNGAEALKNPHEVILSQSYATKYFKGDDPMGKILKIDTASYLVTGVFETTKPSHLSANLIMTEPESADLRWLHTYIKLKEGFTPEEVKKDINALAPELSEVFYNDTEYDLVSIRDIHFKSTSKYQLAIGGNLDTVYILLGIGILILTIASINFVNLTAAVFLKASKESGVRMVLGSNRGQLYLRYFIQSGLTLLIAAVLAGLIFSVITPLANQALGLSLKFSELNLQWVLLVGGLLCFLLLATNALPALRTTRLNQHEVKRHNRTGMYVLMVLQLVIAIVLVVSAFVVRDQVQYLQEKDLGFGEDPVLFVTIDNQNLWTQTTSLRKRFEQHPAILHSSSIMGAPGDGAMMGNQNAWAEGMAPGENVFMPLYAGEEQFVETLGLNVIEGNGFEVGVNANDSITGLLVNETAVRQFGWEDPIGKRMVISGSPCRVVGVLEDFHFLDLHQPIGPLAVMFQPDNYNIALRINRNAIGAALDFIEKQWKTIDAENPFSYFFLDENFQKQYEGEARLIKVLNVLTVLALSICAIGVFGLVLMIMEERVKEIGIRKVLGANLYQLIFLLNKKVLLLILLANGLAWPIAYFLGTGWLQSFAYRVPFDFFILLIALVIIAVIVLSTISFHSIKSALRNPVETLRHE